MTDLKAKAELKGRLLITALIALVVVPPAVAAGYVYWTLAADNPWLLDTPLILLVIFPVFFLLQFWLERRNWLKRMTGGGAFHGQIVEFVSFFLPAIIIFSIMDVRAGQEAGRSVGLADYLATVFVAMACLVAVLVAIELAKIFLARWWKQWRKRGRSAR